MFNKKKILVTGANGFIGKRFIEYNNERFDIVTLSLRDESYKTFDFTSFDSIVHLAGKAHDMNCKDDSEYYKINVDITKTLATKAKANGVKHFVYISSVKVYGNEDRGLITEKSECTPEDAYGKSKLEAEQFLKTLQNENFKVAIVRPPMVYGKGVKGNMDKLIALCNKNYPLPFGNIGNLRTMVFVDNLIDLLNTIINLQAQGIFIPGDKKPISTDDLIIMIRKALGKQPKLITIPKFLRSIIKKFKPALHKRLFGSFVIDTKNTNAILNFVPPYSTEFGIELMCKN
ncbi:MAG: NAD-dependent epimerase/dehydratase family protein [Chitinophagaceae bacterium]